MQLLTAHFPDERVASMSAMMDSAMRLRELVVLREVADEGRDGRGCN